MTHNAAIDISAGHAIDSLFRDDLIDPWAFESLERFIDAAINHPRLMFPFPSADAIKNDSDENLPELFAVARQPSWRLIAGLQSSPADSFSLPDEVALRQFELFEQWISAEQKNLQSLKFWLEMHQHTKRIRLAHGVTVPVHKMASLVERARLEALTCSAGIPSVQQLEYAVDHFLRGIQYSMACGSSYAYFSHPIRDALTLTNPAAIFEAPCAWSWGKYFSALLKDNAKYRDMHFVLESVSALRELSLRAGATWYDIGSYSPTHQLSIIETVASEANLPYKIKEKTQGVIEKNIKGLSIGSGSVGGGLTLLLGNPLLAAFTAIFISAGTYKAGESAKEYISGSNALINFLLAKCRHWPGLSKREL